MQSRRRTAFTLVELLVVIGIIALLISILLPALSKAKEYANTIKCAANLKSIGQGVALYEANYKGALPASNLFAGMQLRGNQQYGPGGTQTSADIWGQGYIHWSSQIFSKIYDTNDPKFGSDTGWDMFKCPDLPNGGVAPCNTYAANRESPCTNEAAGVLDAQAPRMAYMLNEALTPRGRLGKGVPGTVINSVYHYVQAGSVKNSAGTILATENWGIQSLMLTKDQITSAKTASNSRRPVTGFSASLSTSAGLASATAEAFYSATNPEKLVPTTTDKLAPDPSGDQTWVNASTIESTLNFVGRNHGRKGLATVTGSLAAGGTGSINGWDTRTSNFLYLDGHVETKNVNQTIYPVFEWGQKFYDLVR